MTKWRVEFLQHYLGNDPGCVVELEEGYARSLCMRGLAEPSTKELTRAPKDKMQRKGKTKTPWGLDGNN